MGGGGGWAAGGGLYFPIGLFGVPMCPRSTGQLVIGPEKPRGLEMSHQHRGEYQTHTSHLVSSMGTIVSVVSLHGR